MLWPNGTAQRPVVSSPFGPRTGGAFSFHYGVDFVGYSTVRAAGTGKVTFAGWLNPSAGNTVYISYGGGVTEIHMHLASFAVSKGDSVNPGDPLGAMGRTGNATGNCDHFEIRVNGTSVDPIAYTAARVAGVPAGSGGAAEITPATPTTPATPVSKEDDMKIIVVNGNYYSIDRQFLSHLNSKLQVAEGEALYGPARNLGNGNASSDAGKRLIAQLDFHGIPQSVLDGAGRVLNPQSGKYEANGTWSRERELLAKR